MLLYCEHINLRFSLVLFCMSVKGPICIKAVETLKIFESLTFSVSSIVFVKVIFGSKRLHINGLSPECILMLLSMWADWMNNFPHTEQEKDASPEWAMSCLNKCVFVKNYFLHILQTFWTCLWVFGSAYSVKIYLHTLQE